nr:MAG TPA: hypothetical protein [Caudoviricetes sp.]
MDPGMRRNRAEPMILLENILRSAISLPRDLLN